MSLRAAETHGDAVLPGPVAASGQAADLLFLDVRAGWKNKEEKKEKKRVFINTNPWAAECVSVCRVTHTRHSTPPMRTATSLGCPVFRLRPLIVRDEPPALGPLRGETLLSAGS